MRGAWLTPKRERDSSVSLSLDAVELEDAAVGRAAVGQIGRRLEDDEALPWLIDRVGVLAADRLGDLLEDVLAPLPGEDLAVAVGVLAEPSLPVELKRDQPAVRVETAAARVGRRRPYR